MDYQTFNSQQHHLPSSLGGPFSTALPGTSASAHLAQPTHSPQQQQLYADPHGRFQQSAASPFPFANGQQGGFAAMGGGSITTSGGAVTQPGGLSQNQLHQARAVALQQQNFQHHAQQQPIHSPNPYSTAPFSQGLSSPALSAAQKFAQHQQQSQSPSSAGNHVSPYATPQQQHSPSLAGPNHHSPMATATPTSQPQMSQPMQTHTPVRAVPQSPVSPVAQAREKERMTTLLEINNLLIKEVVDLQSQGKAGHIGQQPPTQDGKPDGDKQQPSKEYVECMRRLQSNLAFLAQNAEKNHKPNQPIQPGPAIMAVPSSPPQLVELYIKLQGLYPRWKGQTQQMKVSPGPQRLNSMGQQQANTTMQPPNSAGLQNNMQSNMQSPHSAGLPQNMQQMQQNMNNNINMAQNNIQQRQQQSSTPPQAPHM
ncbi:uncharacterized protein BDR25DRAFT_250209 [Lindgomyces ingoldianus]|uniref:Uncharacterized protein n=1 Tax=Lindgomyces ingoldianus TaxID=673940 RepID=A0ACB6REV9_9PLEO|nr:uncharacterized protein BDR25DRAFT_250209 [Lindgomyces ingoldianus]KAF2477874.1 hypothetical protein BDR25DRAFT_250209 [Lindgomyces ingoldianus]